MQFGSLRYRHNDVFCGMRLFVAVITLLLFVSPVKSQTDIQVLRDINLNRNSRLDPFFQFNSNSVTYVAIGIPVALTIKAFLKKDSASISNASLVVLTQATAGILTELIKYTVNRDRPFITYPELEVLSDHGGSSFPSGHTSAAFASATAISLAFPKWYIALPAYTWASCVGYSRMHLGCHYPSDVLAGAILGIGTGWIMSRVNTHLNLIPKTTRSKN